MNFPLCPRFQAVLFDMDGTLLDTLSDMQDAVNHILLENGWPQRTLEEIRAFVGNGIWKLVERAVPAGTSEAQMDAVYEAFNPYYARHCADLTAPYDGILPLLQKLQAQGVNLAYVTLHVGLGTFRPVKAEEITDHHMHSEFCMMSAETAELLNRTHREGHRIVCVGTTSCRTVESLVEPDGTFREKSAWTDIFIYPGYKFRALDALITNFHLPESTLVMLVSALAGRENILHAYQVAVQEKYRFFSFGDAMFIH